MDKLNPIPLYIQVKDDLLKKIKTEVFDVDEQIPPEAELMKRYGVGRETVRKAIGILVQEGYLHKKRGIGTFVASKKPSIGFEAFISLSHALQVRGLCGMNKVLEQESFIPVGELKERMKWENGQCHYIKRLRYVDTKPLALEYSYFKAEDDYNRLAYNFEESITKYFLEELRIKIEKIEQVITPKKPNKEECQLLEIDSSETILDLERWIFIKGEHSTYYYVRFLIPADFYAYPF